MSSPLALSWVLSTVSGYGIYGLQLMMQLLRRGARIEDIVLTSAPSVTILPALTQAKLEPALALGTRLAAFLKENPLEQLHFKHAALHGVSSDFGGFEGQDRIWGQPNVGCAAIEHLTESAHGRKVSQNYDMFIAISRWNADYLSSLDVGPVHLCHQGIDRSLFHPAPSTGLFKDRFVVFSGGKLEFRKGQDIVLAAFRLFRARHKDALLVTCWQNLLPLDAEAFELAGNTKGLPQSAKAYGFKIREWLLSEGLPADSFIDLPFTPNLCMPEILRECDLAVFPNRCEGGTNLVAMEAMACGVPTYVSYNTGHKDLVDLIGCKALWSQKSVTPTATMRTVQDWGESDVEELVNAMEYVYTNQSPARNDAESVASRMEAWDWGSLNEKLLRLVCDGRT